MAQSFWNFFFLPWKLTILSLQPAEASLRQSLSMMNNYSGRGGRGTNSHRNLVESFGQMTTLLVREQNQERRRRSMRCSNCSKKGHWVRERWAPRVNAQQPQFHAEQAGAVVGRPRGIDNFWADEGKKEVEVKEEQL